MVANPCIFLSSATITFKSIQCIIFKCGFFFLSDRSRMVKVIKIHCLVLKPFLLSQQKYMKPGKTLLGYLT